MTKDLLIAGLFAALIGVGSQTPPPRQTQPPPADNTKVNKQPGLTADQQSQTPEDLALVQKIRKAIMADKSLSTSAHNCKIITRDGTVTLRGPVNSAKEKTTLGAIATKIAGAGKVTNALAITSPK